MSNEPQLTLYSFFSPGCQAFRSHLSKAEPSDKLSALKEKTSKEEKVEWSAYRRHQLLYHPFPHEKRILLVIQNGRIMEIEAGTIKGKGIVKCENFTLLEKESEILNLPGSVKLGEGIAII